MNAGCYLDWTYTKLKTCFCAFWESSSTWLGDISIRFFLDLVVMSKMCASKLGLWETVTPRYLQKTRLSGSDYRVRWKWFQNEWSFLLVINMLLHFVVFKAREFSQVHGIDGLRKYLTGIKWILINHYKFIKQHVIRALNCMTCRAGSKLEVSHH